MGESILTDREISHAEAREIAQRLINSHFNNPGPHARTSIPARPDHDDDLLIMAYIEQQFGDDLGFVSPKFCNVGGSFGLEFDYIYGQVPNSAAWRIWDRHTGRIKEIISEDVSIRNQSVASRRCQILNGIDPNIVDIGALDSTP